MKELRTIADQIGLDITKFHRVSPEDVNINFFWRHAYFVNKGRTGWPAFLVMPYLEWEEPYRWGTSKNRVKRLHYLLETTATGPWAG